MSRDAIFVEVLATRGSAPRDAGTVMKVTAEDIEGTIGGGALEWEAMQTAREMLAAGEDARTQAIPLGPTLGQCCGGHVTLRFSREGMVTDAPAPQVHALRAGPQAAPLDLWLWGAGHVGRAIVAAAHPQDIHITWIDAARDRYPERVRADIDLLPTADMPRLAAHAPATAHHLILTYSHEIDLALCHALLQRPAASIGLIGSATKWARFRSRLGALGHDADQISGITCPIGDPSLGKAPSAIAEGVIRALLDFSQTTAKDRIA